VCAVIARVTEVARAATTVAIAVSGAEVRAAELVAEAGVIGARAQPPRQIPNACEVDLFSGRAGQLVAIDQHVQLTVGAAKFVALQVGTVGELQRNAAAP
jgi:hypothetical protein